MWAGFVTAGLDGRFAVLCWEVYSLQLSDISVTDLLGPVALGLPRAPMLVGATPSIGTGIGFRPTLPAHRRSGGLFRLDLGMMLGGKCYLLTCQGPF